MNWKQCGEEELNFCPQVVHTTVKHVISRRGKNRERNAKCTEIKDTRAKSGKLLFKAGFHMIADDRGSQIADRRSQKVLRSSAIIWKHTSAIACDPAIVIADDRRRSQKIEPCSIFCDRLRLSAIVCDPAIIWKQVSRVHMTFPLNEMYGYSRLCDRLRSSAIIWKQVSLRSSAIYDPRSSAICDRLRSYGNQPLACFVGTFFKELLISLVKYANLKRFCSVVASLLSSLFAKM